MSSQAKRGDTTRCPRHASGTITGIVGAPHCTTNGIDIVRVGDCAQCFGTAEMDIVVSGTATVSIGSRYAARVGSNLWHGGVVSSGSPNVVIGGATISAADIIDAAKRRALEVLKCAENRLNRWNDDDKRMFKKWFGSDSDEAKEQIKDRIAANKNVMNEANYKPGVEDTSQGPITPGSDSANEFAHVYASDPGHSVYLNPLFWSATLEGTDNQAGVLLHETSHFKDVGGTRDLAYGQANALNLASNHPDQALNNADSYEYFMEEAQETCGG